MCEPIWIFEHFLMLIQFFTTLSVPKKVAPEEANNEKNLYDSSIFVYTNIHRFAASTEVKSRYDALILMQ